MRNLPKIKTTKTQREACFEVTKFSANNKKIHIKIKNCRSLDVKGKVDRTQTCCVRNTSGVIASGLLNRFRYKLNKPTPFPIFGALTL